MFFKQKKTFDRYFETRAMTFLFFLLLFFSTCSTYSGQQKGNDYVKGGRKRRKKRKKIQTERQSDRMKANIKTDSQRAQKQAKKDRQKE